MKKMLYFFFILSFVLLSQSYEPIRIDSNHTSKEGFHHFPSKRIPDKYLTSYKVVIRIKNDSNVSSKKTIDQIANDHGFINEGPLGKLPGYYIWSKEREGDLKVKSIDYTKDNKNDFYDKENIQMKRISSSLEESDQIEWWDHMVPRERVKRAYERFEPSYYNERTKFTDFSEIDTRNVPYDPLFSKQWHLRGSHLNVIRAWSVKDTTGKGINLAIVDDGVQREHPDLSKNFRMDLSWDFNENDEDPEPFRSDGHGTSAAGVAVAIMDNHCGVGVSPDANLIGLRLLGAWVSDSDEAQALCHKCDEDDMDSMIHIYSNSWGPSDEGVYLGGPGPLVPQAFEYCTSNGRNGKGSIYVWAGGNGRYNGDNSNYDGYANSRYTIAVAAVDYNGMYTWYSEPGANILCAAPSSGFQTNSITTTDLLSSWGYSPNGCTDSFGGTSAAAPQIAGVVALMLSNRPDLGWRDVQDIIVHTSKITNERHTSWTENAAGLKHSHDYGFGLVDAEKAVISSSTWELKKTNNGYNFSSGFILPTTSNSHVVNDYTKDFLWSVSPNYHGSSNVFNIKKLEHVTLYVEIETPSTRQCLDLTLIGPSGVESLLHSGRETRSTDKRVEWTFSTVRHWGESIYYYQNEDKRTGEESTKLSNNGIWIVRIKDSCEKVNANSNSPNNIGNMILRKWKIDFYGE